MSSMDWQGVVTLIGPVEPFATRIKIKSRDQHIILYTKSSDQGKFQRGDQAVYRRVGLSKTYIYKVSC